MLTGALTPKAIALDAKIKLKVPTRFKFKSGGFF
jgi:hypothetical protein